MNWRPRIATASIWTLPLLGVDIGYILHHGFDAAAFGFTAVTFLSAWVFLGRSVDVKFPGGGIKITEEDVAKTVEEAHDAGPKSVKQAEEQVPALRQEVKERTAALSDGALKDLHWTEPRPQYYTGRDMVILQQEYGWNAFEDESAARDPNLALVSLRIDIERRLAQLGDIFQIPPRNLRTMVAKLTNLKVFNDDFAGVLMQFIEFGNQAAHGALVDPQAARDVLRGRAVVLGTLDAIIGEVTEGIKTDEKTRAKEQERP